MLLTDDRLMATMRSFVTASNRLENLVGRQGSDLMLMEQVSEDLRLAGIALREALVARGWQSPG